MSVHGPYRRELMSASAATTSGGGPRPGNKKRARAGGDVAAPPGVGLMTTTEVRRSGRIRNQPAPIYTSFEVDEDLGDAHARARKRREKKQAAADYAAAAASRKDAKGVAAAATSDNNKNKKNAAPPAENSIKTLDARMRRCATRHLGAPIYPTDGTGAMKAAAIHAVSPISNPRFSKYSGIQEWGNCVCLFVNVGDKNGNSYDNVFTHAGGRITWFAQPRQHEETPVIERIVATSDAEMDELAAETAPMALSPDATVAAAADEAEAEDEDKEEEKEEEEERDDDDEDDGGGPVWPLHLFCRMEGCEYVYCGRLRRVEHDPNKTPMKFLFRLLDAPLLRTSDDFLALVDLADADASLGQVAGGG